MIRQAERRLPAVTQPVRSSPTAARGPARRARFAAYQSLIIVGVVLWFEAILVWTSPDVPQYHVLAIALVGTFGLFLHLPPLTRRLWFWSAVGMLGVLFLTRLLAFPPVVADQGFIVFPQGPTVVLAEFSLACLCLLIWRWQWPDPLPIAIPCVALVTSFFALNKTLPMASQSTYTWLAAIAVLMPTALAVASVHGPRSQPVRRSRGAHVIVIGVWCAVIFGTVGLTEAWSRWLPDAQTWFAGNVGRPRLRRQRVVRYVASGALNAIRQENSINPNAVALKVYADQQPGYLAGRVFDQYSNGKWYIGAPSRSRIGPGQLRTLEALRRVPSVVGLNNQNLSTFARDAAPAPASVRRLVIENDPRRGSVFFTPLDWRYFQTAGMQLTVDEFGIVRSGVSVYTPYVVHADAASASRPLPAQLRRRLLTPPRGLDPRIAALAAKVCRGARTTRAKVRAVADYFQNNYAYSLTPVAVAPGVDPLNHFLLARHPAHCEFFASGAVALLRLQGVPARYATGYRVMELDDKEEHAWVARNREAHAWAEAYDEQRQQWVVVEATPGFTSPADETADEELGGGGGVGGIFVAPNANAIWSWWVSQSPLVQSLVTLSALALVGLGVFWVRRSRQKRARPTRAVDPRLRRWRRQLRRMDRRLQRRGMIRPPTETLHQFARRVQATTNSQSPWLHACAAWYVAYANARFRSLDAAPPPLPVRAKQKR